MDKLHWPQQSRLVRWCHRLYAFVLGYFWLPCPVCGEPFGGHEWRDIDGLPCDVPKPISAWALPERPWDWTFVGICPRCTRAGRGSRRWTEQPL